MLGRLLRWLITGDASPASKGAAPKPINAPGMLNVAELGRRLGLSPQHLQMAPIQYHAFQIPKRSGGTRTILAPSKELKALQRRILHRLLGKLRCHPAATGFERGHSIVTHALPHAGQPVVIRLDLKEFFPSTAACRVEDFFRFVGWDAEAAALLTRLCTHQGSLPQGAPTSPRLSNLVNQRLDARLEALAHSRGARYSRYADDITFSGGLESPEGGAFINPKTLQKVDGVAGRINDLIHMAKVIAEEEGYRVHMHKKLRIARAHHRQVVTGLVVNHKPNLPRSTRRWLRAVEHHIATGRPATLTAAQVQGWQALRSMIAVQSEGPEGEQAQ